MLLRTLFATLTVVMMSTPCQADNFATVTSSNGWSVTVIVRYIDITPISPSNNCQYGFNYYQNFEYEVTYSDGGAARSYYIGIGGGCFTNSGTIGIPENSSLSGTFKSHNKYSNSSTPCNNIDPEDYFCGTMNLTISGPGMPERIVPMNYVDTYATLPISLDKINAREERGGILVEWFAEDEDGRQNYILQHSRDGVHWIDHRSLPVKKSYDTSNSYSVFDAQPMGKRNFYRIVVESLDGVRSFSEVVSVTRAEEQIYLAPNPVRDRLTVRGFQDIRILSMDGRDVTTLLSVKENGDGSYSIDVSNLRAGVYLIHSATGTGRFQRI